MALACTCDGWKVNEPKVNGPIILQSIRAGRDLYDGDPFRFCPWCGKELVDGTNPADTIAVSPGKPPASPPTVPPSVAPLNLTMPQPITCARCHALIWPHIIYDEHGTAFITFQHACSTPTGCL